MERLDMDTEIVCGEDALDVLTEFRGASILLVTEPALRGSARTQRILDAVRPESAAIFDAAAPEPTVRQAMDGANCLDTVRPQLVVALGGASVLNCAKAMVCFAKHPCPLTVIPTVAGSLGETSGSVALFHNGELHRLQGTKMRPQQVILDVCFCQGEEGRQTAEGGFRLLAAALEAYTGRNAGMMTSFYGKEAFSSGWAVLPGAFSGKLWAMKRLQVASVMGSIAIDQAGQGLCAALCGALESLFRINSGRLSAILLPAVVGFNGAAAGARYTELSRAAGLGGSSEAVGVRNLKAGLVRLRGELGLPGTLAQAGIPPGRIWGNVGRIVERTLADPECRNNPVTVDDFMVRRILDAITGRI